MDTVTVPSMACRGCNGAAIYTQTEREREREIYSEHIYYIFTCRVHTHIHAHTHTNAPFLSVGGGLDLFCHIIGLFGRVVGLF